MNCHGKDKSTSISQWQQLLVKPGAHSIQNDDEVILSSGTEENSSSSASGLVLFISSIAISDLFLILANYQRQ